MMDYSPTIEGILSQAETLDDRSFDRLYTKLSLLRFRRAIPERERRERMLLKKINVSFPLDKILEMKELQQKMSAGTLTETEHTQLGKLVEESSKLDVRRLKHLLELSKLRNVNLPRLMADLGIRPPEI